MIGNLTRRKFITRNIVAGATLSTTAMFNEMTVGTALAQQVADQDATKWKGDPSMTSSHTPISIQSVVLTVNDLDLVGEFYQSVLGLTPLARNGEELILGAGDSPLLILRKDANARRYPAEAGLFHNAFLMPDRVSLGNWLRHAVEIGVRLTGAADHDVSEAIYLDDPEGNGIEVYVDRPVETWGTQADGQIQMGSHWLDLENILSSGTGSWQGAPVGMVIGHVHLQVGSTKLLHEFMTTQLGQDLTLHEGSAGFYSSGGYHHHFAGNIWQSPNAGYRSANSTGLAEVVLVSDGTVLQPTELTDPWGTNFTVNAL